MSLDDHIHALFSEVGPGDADPPMPDHISDGLPEPDENWDEPDETDEFLEDLDS